MALFRKRAASVFPCDAGLVYEVLTDYDTYSEWMPFIVRSKLLAREGDLAIAEFDYSHPREEKVAVEFILTRNQMVLSRTIGANHPASRLQWDIVATEGGQCQVKVSVEGRANWHWLLPWYWKFMSARVALAALQSRTTLFQPEAAGADEGGEKILEVMETDEGLILWIKGRKYTLKAIEGQS